MNIQIRRAALSDVPAIASLLRSLGFFARISAEALETTQMRVAAHLTLAAADDSHLILVAETPQGELAGYCAAHWLPYLILPGPEGYVSELFVQESFRAQGIGRELLSAIQAEAKQHGCSRLMLLNLRKRESYQRRFYQKQGWEERPEMANFVLSLTDG